MAENGVLMRLFEMKTVKVSMIPGRKKTQQLKSINDGVDDLRAHSESEGYGNSGNESVIAGIMREIGIRRTHQQEFITVISSVLGATAMKEVAQTVPYVGLVVKGCLTAKGTFEAGNRVLAQKKIRKLKSANFTHYDYWRAARSVSSLLELEIKLQAAKIATSTGVMATRVLPGTSVAAGITAVALALLTDITRYAYWFKMMTEANSAAKDIPSEAADYTAARTKADVKRALNAGPLLGAYMLSHADTRQNQITFHKGDPAGKQTWRNPKQFLTGHAKTFSPTPDFVLYSCLKG
jgi:hypothetical protein